MRQKLKDIVDPVIDNQKKDRTQMNEIQLVFNEFLKRLDFIEGIFEQGQGKNVVFDRIMETLNNAEVERLRFTAYCQGQIDQLTDQLDHAQMTVSNHTLQINTHNDQIKIQKE